MRLNRISLDNPVGHPTDLQTNIPKACNGWIKKLMEDKPTSLLSMQLSPPHDPAMDVFAVSYPP